MVTVHIGVPSGRPRDGRQLGGGECNGLVPHYTLNPHLNYDSGLICEIAVRRQEYLATG